MKKSNNKNKTLKADNKKGLSFKRYFTKENQSPFEQFKYELRNSIIRNPDGDVVFEKKNDNYAGFVLQDGPTEVINKAIHWDKC